MLTVLWIVESIVFLFVFKLIRLYFCRSVSNLLIMETKVLYTCQVCWKFPTTSCLCLDRWVQIP